MRYSSNAPRSFSTAATPCVDNVRDVIAETGMREAIWEIIIMVGSQLERLFWLLYKIGMS
jgi:hypothetical protein